VSLHPFLAPPFSLLGLRLELWERGRGRGSQVQRTPQDLRLDHIAEQRVYFVRCSAPLALFTLLRWRGFPRSLQITIVVLVGEGHGC
jgi:hypothetical protein